MNRFIETFKGMSARYTWFFSAILLVTWMALASCTAKSPSDSIQWTEAKKTITYRQILIDRWEGEIFTKDGDKRSWVMERFPDGTYRVSFRVVSPGNKEIQQVEVGLWGISGGVYFTLTRGVLENDQVVPADTTDPTLYDAYRIISLTDQTFEY